MRASGIPTNSTACWVAIASGNASASARPTSSLAKMTMRRAMKRKSSPGVQHLGEPVDRAFFVGGAHALDEGADRVVVRVAGAIVNHGLGLDAFLRHLESEMNQAFVVRWSGQDADFERVQTFAGVAVAQLREVAPRLGIHLHPMLPETALFIPERALDQDARAHPRLTTRAGKPASAKPARC